MRITLHTDYAFRVLLYLALEKDKRVTIATISKYFSISHNHLRKIIHALSRTGYIKTYLGRDGGMILFKKPSEINLSIIFSLFEESEWIDCKGRRCRLSNYCSLHDVFYEAEQNFLTTMSKYTLKDLINDEKMHSHFQLD